MILKYGSLILLGTFISSVSQIMLKSAALKTYDLKIKEYVNPTVISAYVLFFLATLLSILAYKGIPLSLGPILEATSYIYVTFFGVKFFGEKINRRKIIALALILVGIYVFVMN